MANRDSVLDIALTFLKVITTPPFRFGTQLMGGIPNKLWLRFWKEWDQLQVCIISIYIIQLFCLNSHVFAVDDFLILSDHNETKNFNIKLDRAGTKTCIAVDFGDDDEENPEYDFYGHLKSCRIRFPHLTAEMVEPFDSFTKTFDVTHTYR